MKNNKIKVGIILFTFSIVLLSIPQMVSAEEDTSLSDVITAGKIVVGTDAAYPPFEQITDGEIEGFDPDIMNFVAEDMGVTVEYKDVAWTTIFTSLAAGNYDCVISAVTITTDRMQTMNFTRWYYFSTQAVMVTDDSTLDITTIADVDDASIKVGLQSDTTSQWYLEDEEYAAEIVGFTTITLALAALDAGTVDVVLGDLATLVSSGNAIDSDKFVVVDTFSPEAFGIACQGGSNALVERMNEALDKLLGEDPFNPVFSTEYNASHEEWMGSDVLVDLGQLKIALDELGVTVDQNTISGMSIFSLIAIIPVTFYGIIRKYKKKHK